MKIAICDDDKQELLQISGLVDEYLTALCGRQNRSPQV